MEIPLPILAALAGAVAGGIVSLLVKRRERREEASLSHLQRQIEELYGPLYGLIEFGTAIREIEEQRLPKASRNDDGSPKDEQGGRVLQFFREHYYLPLNKQMIELIRTKLYLLDSDAIPKSFTNFIRHAAQFESFHQLWKEADISTHGVKPIKYPPELKSEVHTTLNELRREYNEYIMRMKERGRLHKYGRSKQIDRCN